MSTTLGKNIKDLRTSLNMTLADVAEKTGVSRQTIQRYESGVISNIPAQRLQALASALGTTPDYLMGLSQFKTKEEMTKYFDDKFLTPELVEEANRPDGQVVGYVPGLSDKEEKDIQKKLDNILNQLDNETGLMFDGEVVDDETKEKLRISLEMVMRGAKKEAKEKFGRTVWGGFDNRPGSLIYTGTKEEIESEVKRLIEAGGKNGYIIGPDCSIHDELSEERIKWIVEAARKI